MTKESEARILGIETSCDETAVAIIENGKKLLSNIVYSQIEIHIPYGGVFPEIASRQHVKSIYHAAERCLQNAHLTLAEIDAIAVTRGPGLAGSLVVGMNFAKGLAISKSIPIIGVHHLEAHIYSAWIQHNQSVQPIDAPQFPLICLIVSGGHTELVYISDHLNYRRLGGTLDDAAGEAFDKVARLLKLPYPGGPSIQEAAINGNPKAYNFPRAKLEGTWEFSFSGLKTAVLREVKRFEEQNNPVPTEDIAASFQDAVVDILVEKTLIAAETFNVKELLVTGGVSANEVLRNAFYNVDQFNVNIPPIKLCTDNAAMVAAAGYFRYIKGHKDTIDMDVLPTWTLS